PDACLYGPLYADDPRKQGHVVLDFPHALHAFHQHPQRPTLVVGVHRSPQLDHAVGHGQADVGRLEPGLSLDLVPDRLLQGTVARALGGSDDRHLGQPAHQVGAADHADELAVVQHRHLAHAVSVEKVGHLGQARLRRHADDVARHDVPGSDAVALDVFAGLDVRVGEDLEPPFAALLRVRLAAMGQVRLADDADDVVVPLDHGHG